MSNQARENRCVVVSCGTLRPELQRLQDNGLLPAEQLLFTGPGLHENPAALEKQLKKQLTRGQNLSGPVIVVYGATCFVNTKDPLRDIDALLREQGPSVSRIQAANCVDMLVGREERR